MSFHRSRLPGAPSRPGSDRSSTSSDQPAAHAGQPALPALHPLVGPLRDAEAFRTHLFAVVESEMSKLTDARALDEWHREVLDPRIAAEVEQEVRRIQMAARTAHTTLTGDHVAARAELAQLERLESDAQDLVQRAIEGVLAARARLVERRTGVAADMRDSVVGTDCQAELAGIRTELDSHREAIARVLKATRTESEQQLATVALAAEQAVRDVERRIAEQESVVARAENDVRAAHDRYRGADPVVSTGAAASSGLTVAAAPDQQEDATDNQAVERAA